MNKLEKALLDLSIERKYGPVASGQDTDILTYILNKETGKISNVLSIPNPTTVSSSYIREALSDDDFEKLNKIYEDIIKDYNFERCCKYLTFGTPRNAEESNYYSPRYPGFQKNVVSFYREGLLYSEDLNFICRTENYNSETTGIDLVIYTEDTKDVALDIFKRYSDFCFEKIKDNKEKIETLYTISTLVVDSEGVCQVKSITIPPTVSLTEPDFMDNYNSDFPEKSVSNFLNMDRGGIIIFNGEPGCGKSTYLKSLIFRYPDIKFVVLPQNLLLNQEAFRYFLLRTPSSDDDYIYIIEDCEKLLVSRDSQLITSSVIGDILNYTDGIYGDLTRTKFIFTFNTDLKNIDNALLRPGRLSVKYQFTKLKGENLKKIANKLNYKLSEKDLEEGITLSELYYNSKTDDLIIGSKPPRKKIGFRAYEDELLVKCGELCDNLQHFSSGNY